MEFGEKTYYIMLNVGPKKGMPVCNFSFTNLKKQN